MYATQGLEPRTRSTPMRTGLLLLTPSSGLASVAPQAQGMPRPAMWNNLAFVLVNAALNWTFVFGGPFQYAPIGWHGFGFVGAPMRPCGHAHQCLAKPDPNH